ncbi:MAG: hypothetical protein CMJ16_00660 [Peredibacter sp.]|nr:hypothetical protein [Peredibacter sp.]
MKKLINVTTAIILTLAATGCKNEEETGLTTGSANYPVNLSMGSYTVAKTSPLDFLIPSAYAAISDLKFCFKRLRFKRDLPDGQVDTSEDNVDLELAQVNMNTSGVALGQVSVPADTYKRIEFDLEPNCGGLGENSVDLANDWGVHTSSSTITIKFEGTFIVDGQENLELGVQNIIDAANAYDGVGSLKDALEAVSGVL